jgi:uncharacterized RDD family membrane protein YckC
VSGPGPWARVARPRDRDGECDPFRRVGARVIDIVVLTPFAAVLLPIGHRHHHDSLVALVLLAITAVYEIVGIAVWGRTIGKLATHIRVVAADGARATWGQSAVRWVVLPGVATVLATYVGYVGILWGALALGLVFTRGLGPHDVAGRTKVITEVRRPESTPTGGRGGAPPPRPRPPTPKHVARASRIGSGAPKTPPKSPKQRSRR